MTGTECGTLYGYDNYQDIFLLLSITIISDHMLQITKASAHSEKADPDA